jgi:hypothetical protein
VLAGRRTLSAARDARVPEKEKEMVCSREHEGDRGRGKKYGRCDSLRVGDRTVAVAGMSGPLGTLQRFREFR